MKHVESCKHKFNSNHKTSIYKIQQQDNQELFKSMNNEIINLRNEVCELRRLIYIMLNQKSVNMVDPGSNIAVVSDVTDVTNVTDVTDVTNVTDVPKIQNTISYQNISKIKIIDNTSSNQLEEVNCIDCNVDCNVDFDTFISRLDFCNQSQLFDIFDSDDIVESFFYLWNEALNKLKYNNNSIPMKYKNNQIIVYEKGKWSNLEMDKLEKVISYLHEKVVQQLSIYQTTPKIKSRIENEATFREYYLNQVTKINSDKLMKNMRNNCNLFIDNLGRNI
jgi:hypothetical protein